MGMMSLSLVLVWLILRQTGIILFDDIVDICVGLDFYLFVDGGLFQFRDGLLCILLVFFVSYSHFS